MPPDAGMEPGCPAWIRTMTKASKGPCATITPPDKIGERALKISIAPENVSKIVARHGVRRFPRSTAAEQRTAVAHRDNRGTGIAEVISPGGASEHGKPDSMIVEYPNTSGE